MSELSSVGRTHSWVGLPVWAAAAGVWVLHGGAPAQFRHWSRGVVTVGVVRRCNSPGGAWGSQWVAVSWNMVPWAAFSPWIKGPLRAGKNAFPYSEHIAKLSVPTQISTMTTTRMSSRTTRIPTGITTPKIYVPVLEAEAEELFVLVHRSDDGQPAGYLQPGRPGRPDVGDLATLFRALCRPGFGPDSGLFRGRFSSLIEVVSAPGWAVFPAPSRAGFCPGNKVPRGVGWGVR